jgi:hypothetical protein
LTIYTNHVESNIYAAQKEVLMASPGMTEDIVNRIIDQRESQNFKQSGYSVRSRDNYSSLVRFVDVTNQMFILLNLSFSGDEKKGFGIRAVVLLRAVAYPL